MERPMGQDEKKTGLQASTPVERQRKPYAKPALRRLGTVRELTRGHPSKHAGK
jgi:hypothetical protein